MFPVSVARLLIALCLLAISGCVLTGSGRVEDSPKSVVVERGLWITRWDYQSPDDIRRAISDAGSIGMTDIYWQVRGQADAYYPSSREPWGIELLKYNPDPPGFDPLKIAVEECKLHKMKIHAWVNVMPLWKGKQPPRDSSHIFHTNPEWRLRDAEGNVQKLHDGYVVVNPVLDEVQDHIVGVIRDIVKRYDVDGIHLDYVRYLADEIKPGQLMPGDPISLSKYAQATGSSSEPSKIDREAYQRWVRSRITDLVERIDQESIANTRGVRLSAAVWRRPDLARDRYLQDAAAWVRDGTVDAVMPMIYTDKHEQYRSDLASWHAEVEQRRVIPGIGVYKHAASTQTSYQIATGHPKRFALFAYSSLFESANPDQKKDRASIDLRARHRDGVAALVTRVGAP